MKRQERSIAVVAAATALALSAAGAHLALSTGWRLNFTASEPRGLYRLRPLNGLPLSRGTLAELCPPAWVTPAAFPFYLSGDCPGGGRALLKTIVGIPGDRIDVSAEGVQVNGVTLPDSAPRSTSSQYPQVSLPRVRGQFVLAAGQYWVYGSGARPALAALSFDSRYFGPITALQLRGIVVPISTRAFGY